MTDRTMISVALLATIVSCGDGSSICPDCATAPEALPADDGKPSGVYKGVVAGEKLSGTIKVNIQISSFVLGTCDLVVNNQSYQSTKVEATQGPYSYNKYTFTGSSFILVLSINLGDGSVRSSSLTLNGVKLSTAIAKETSTQLVGCFQGTWSGTGLSGIWNLVVTGDQIKGIFRGATSGSFSGAINGDSFSVKLNSFLCKEECKASGTLSGKTASGTWTFTKDYTGTWSGVRTL